MRKILVSLLTVAVMGISGVAGAHSFWVSAYDSFTHAPGHILVMLGFGHHMPVDDLLSGDFGNIRIKKMGLTGPDGKYVDIELPVTARQKRDKLPWGTSIEKGDLGIRKISMGKDSPKGTYMVTAESVPAYIAKYINKKGKMSFAMKPMDQIKDAKEVTEAFKYSAYSKSFVGFKEWSTPVKAGHDLEVVPLVDLSNVRVGDLVSLRLLFWGKNLILLAIA